jgi:hypothetical protein
MFSDGMSRISAKGDQTINRANRMQGLLHVSGQTYASADLDINVLETKGICVLEALKTKRINIALANDYLAAQGLVSLRYIWFHIHHGI